MFSGRLMNTWMDSLQAFFPGLQVLIGDVEDAICLHAFYYAIWKRYGALPERYNWQLQAPDVFFYPLRPELVESTYLLYQVRSGPRRVSAPGSWGLGAWFSGNPCWLVWALVSWSF